MTDLTDELRAACLSHCQLPTRPDGPTDEELAVLAKHVYWRAAAEIDRLRRHAAAAWQPMESGPKDGSSVVLVCPGPKGQDARGVAVWVWSVCAQRRTVGL